MSLLDDGSTPLDEQILLDPHGRGLRQVHRAPGQRGVTQPDTYGSRYVSEIIDDAFDWAGDLAPDIPWRDTVIYEAHVKGLTIHHPGIPEELRGTYAGLAHPVMIEHLSSLGISAVELHERGTTAPAVARPSAFSCSTQRSSEQEDTFTLESEPGCSVVITRDHGSGSRRSSVSVRSLRGSPSASEVGARPKFFSSSQSGFCTIQRIVFCSESSKVSGSLHPIWLSFETSSA